MIIAMLILSAGIVATIYAIATAPRGYEDCGGFHVLEQNQPRELGGNTLRTSRARLRAG